MLEYAAHLRNIVGPAAYLEFLQGKEIEHRQYREELDMVIITSFKLSEPAKDVLIEEAKT